MHTITTTVFLHVAFSLGQNMHFTFLKTHILMNDRGIDIFFD